MFRIEFFVDDKKLGNALHALVGIAHGQPNVQPVSNAMKKGNGIAAVSKGGTEEQFMDQVRKSKLTEFTPAQAGPLLKSIGLKPSSASYVMKKLLHAGLLTRSGKSSRTTYHLAKKG